MREYIVAACVALVVVGAAAYLLVKSDHICSRAAAEGRSFDHSAGLLLDR